MLPGASSARGRTRPRVTDVIPLARPLDRRARGGARARGAALGAAVARARCWPRSSSAFAASLGADARLGGLERHGRPAPRHPRRRASSRATRSSPRRSASWRRPTACSTRARSPVFCDIDPRTLNIDPDAADAARRRSAPPACCRCTSSATRPTCRRSSGCRASCGLWIVEDACEALGAVHADGTPVGARGNLRVFGFYPNKQITTGEGGAVVSPVGRGQGAHRLRAQPGPRARHGLARPRPARLQLPARRHVVRARAWRSSSASTSCWPAARAWRRCTAEALADVEGLDLPCPDAGGDRRSWFVYVVQLPHGVDRDAAVVALRERGRGHEALPAGDPPDELLPRALRPPRGRVPGLRGRGSAARWRCPSSRS